MGLMVSVEREALSERGLAPLPAGYLRLGIEFGGGLGNDAEKGKTEVALPVIAAKSLQLWQHYVCIQLASEPTVHTPVVHLLE